MNFNSTRRRAFAPVFVTACALLGVAGTASAQETVRVGLVLETSGPFAEFGQQMQSGMQVYQKQFGTMAAGKRVELIVKDAGGPNPELAKRLATELITRDKVQVLAGFGFTPNALAVAPVATQAKVPMVVMNAAATGLTQRSPYMVRTSFNYADVVPPIARWALKAGSKKAYVMVADYAPGHDAEAAFIKAYKEGGGEIVGTVRTPMMTMDFSAYMQRVKDARPDVLFAFVNGGNVSPTFFKEYREKGLDQAGIKVIGTGDIVDEGDMQAIGDRALDAVTVFPYSMDHPSALNARYVRDFKSLRGPQARPSLMSVSAYDGLALIYSALKATRGNTDGDALVNAMRAAAWESPRGQVRIDPRTREIVQNEYIRRVTKVGPELRNREFETYPAETR
jgi:branched-chain amino acid transport system substrate-binding protein